MPARKDRDASITIRPGDRRMGTKNLEEILPLQKVIDWLDSQSDCYLIGLEQPGSVSSQHYEIAAILRQDQKISDDLKKKLINYVDDAFDYPMDADQRVRTVECKYHNNIKLRFGYCSKDSVIYKKGVSEEFHRECIDVYNTQKRSEKSLPVSRSRLLPLIREMYDILWNELARDSDKMSVYGKYDNPKRFAVLEKMLIIRGYDLTCISPSNKREIIMNFEEYIVGNAENHLTDLDLIK